MAYTLDAIIAARPLLDRHRQRYASVRVAPLQHGLGLIPLAGSLPGEIAATGTDAASATMGGSWDWTPEFAAWFNRNGCKGAELPPFCNLSPLLVAWIEHLSHDGAVAYVEVECWGGPCSQVAAIWRDGGLVEGPVVDEFGPDVPPSVLGGAVNHALRWMGIVADCNLDEFEAVGLGTYRFTGDWLDHDERKPLGRVQ